jgi:hypothetical protein
MKRITVTIALLGIFILALSSCHKDQTYYCYLVEKDWPSDADTLRTYDEAFWFYKKRTKPQDQCKVDRADLIIANQWNFNYSCDCLCGWE